MTARGGDHGHGGSGTAWAATAPVMVPVTAVCWVALMIGAMITHGRLGQYKLVVVNAVYVVLAVFIAVGRFGPESFVA